MAKTLDHLVDRLSEEIFELPLSEAHEQGICINCLGAVGEFPDEESRVEYGLSGLGPCCQEPE